MASLKAKIKMTHRCPNNCWYCFMDNEDRDISTEMLSTIINKLKQMYDTGNFSRLKVSISGGDPFSTDKSLMAAKMLNKTFKENNIDIFYYGEVCVYADLERVKKFRDLGGGLLFSLNEDDPELVAQRQRSVTPEGTMNILFTKKNVDRMDQIIDVIKKYKLRVRCNHIYDETNKHGLIEYMNKGAEKLLNALIDMNYVFPYTISTFGNMNYLNPGTSYCGYGESYFSFDIDGNVSRCQMESPVATVFDDDLIEKIKTPRPLLDKCGSCDKLDLCKGGCYHVNKNGLFCDAYYKLASMLSGCMLDREKNEND